MSTLIKKRVPWSGWQKQSPKGYERTLMLEKCGKKCFLGPNKSFPICTKNTCKINRKGIWAAYIRSRQWGGTLSKYKTISKPTHKRSVYLSVSKKASRMLKRKSKKKSRKKSRRKSRRLRKRSRRKSRKRSRRKSRKRSRRKSRKRSRRKSKKY